MITNALFVRLDGIANTLMARADEMLVSAPSIESIDVLGMKNQPA